MPEKTSQHLFSSTKGCKGIQGASLLHSQTGGGLGTKSHAVDNFNHASASSYGFDEQGAAVSHELRGSYPAMTKNFDRNFCGGKKKKRTKAHKKRRRKSKKSRKSRKHKRKSSKMRRKHNKRMTRYKKSRSNKKRRRRRTKKRTQKGGSSISYSTLNKSLIGSDARILGTNSLMVNNKTCGDNYNHFTGGESKSLY